MQIAEEYSHLNGEEDKKWRKNLERIENAVPEKGEDKR